jgi:hypothetical protein
MSCVNSKVRWGLPALGHELSVQLPSGQIVWLIRTPTHYLVGYPKRGWVWAIHSADRINTNW